MPYPNIGFSEDYIETPSTSKHGLIVPVTREAVFFDRTNLILSRAANPLGNYTVAEIIPSAIISA